MVENTLPLGSRDEYGAALRAKNQLKQRISAFFEAQNYTPISTPLIEKPRVFAADKVSEQFHFYDRIGEAVTLRSDMTLPIARFMAANQMTTPVNLYYVGDVFHASEPMSGAYNQMSQAGIEVIDQPDLLGEQQALQALIDLAQELDIGPLEIELADVRFADALLETTTIPLVAKDALKQAVFNKDWSSYLTQLDALDVTNDVHALLANWPIATSRDESVFDLLPDTPALTTILQAWQTLKNELTTKSVTVRFDLAAAPTQPYYTGMMFKAFAPKLGRYVFTGGRYDELLVDATGRHLSAVGAGFDIEHVLNPIAMATTKPLIYVLAKGRVTEDAKPLLAAAGVDIDVLDSAKRQLFFQSADGQSIFILVKPDDVLRYLDNGIGDVGLVGSDTLYEAVHQHFDMLDLRTGKAQFVLASKTDWQMTTSGRKRIATKYPKRTRDYFAKRGEDVDIVKLSGSVELAPLTGLAYAIVDITQTGATLRENHLAVFDELGDISTRLVVHRQSLRRHQAQLMPLLTKLMQLTGGFTNETT